MTTLTYPAPTGYLWNLMQKIALALGIPMENVWINGCGATIDICLATDATPAQRAQIDAIMATADPCGVPESPGTSYRLTDLWYMRQWIFQQFGITPTLWFEKGNDDGSGECYIYINFPRTLSKTEKTRILNAYYSMMTER